MKPRVSKKNNIYNLKENFWKKVEKTDYCWNWTGKIRKDGYGVICINYKEHRVHRIVFKILGKVIDKENIVLHKCDNPRCVNPKHLKIGTQAENLQDMRNKLRNKTCLKGFMNPNARFNKHQIEDILLMSKNGIQQHKIASMFNVCQQTISKIVTKKRYA